MVDGADERMYNFYDRLRASLVNQNNNTHNLFATPSTHNLFATPRVVETADSSSWKVAERHERSSVLRVVPSSSNDQSDLDENDDGSYRLMHVACVMGFSRGESSVQYTAWDRAKAILMAQYHFNHQLDSVVPNLAELLTDPTTGRKCNVKMTVDFYDTGRNPRIGAGVLSQHVHTRAFPYETTAVIGTYRSAVSLPMAVLNTARQIPQISHASTSNKLSERGSYGMFGRVVPSNNADGFGAIEFFANIAKTTHLAILYVDDDYGAPYRVNMERVGQERGMVVQSVGVTWDVVQTDNLRQSLAQAVDFLVQTGYRHFFGIIFVQHLEILVELGTERGIMGPGNFWMFGGGVSPSLVEEWKFPATAPHAYALQGIGAIALGSAKADGSYDRYAQALEEIDKDSKFREYFASKSPLATDKIQFESNYTSPSPPSLFSDFAYDAMMSLGIAACQSEHELFTGDQLLDQFFETKFSGATGKIELDAASGSRRIDTVSLAIRNARAQDVDENGFVSYKFVVAGEFLRVKSPDDGIVRPQWVKPSGVEFSYSDFTHKPPASLPPLDIKDIINPAIYGAFVGCASLIMMCSVLLAIWTWWARKDHVVRASQPMFLLVICLGEFLMALAVVTAGATHPPQSFGWANFSCMATVWLFVIGFSVVFSALFAKMWRIYKIFSNGQRFLRVTVTVVDVALPGTILVLGNIIIIAAWQIIDPLRYEIQYNELGSMDQYGRLLDVASFCRSDSDTGVYFLGVSATLMLVAMIAANLQGYRTRKFKSEYSESVYIEISMVVILQASALGLPVFFFDADPQSIYVARSSLVLLISASTLFLIFLPKVWANIRHERQRRKLAQQRKLRRSAAQALAASSGSGTKGSNSNFVRHSSGNNSSSNLHRSGSDEVLRLSGNEDLSDVALTAGLMTRGYIPKPAPSLQPKSLSSSPYKPSVLHEASLQRLPSVQEDVPLINNDSDDDSSEGKEIPKNVLDRDSNGLANVDVCETSAHNSTGSPVRLVFRLKTLEEGTSDTTALNDQSNQAEDAEEKSVVNEHLSGLWREEFVEEVEFETETPLSNLEFMKNSKCGGVIPTIEQPVTDRADLASIS